MLGTVQVKTASSHFTRIKAAQARVLGVQRRAEAIELFRRHADEIAAVLLELTMPQKSGEQVLAEIRAVRPSVAVVLSSGFAEEEATRPFSGQALAGFIQKPYRPSQMVELIRRVVATRG